MIRRLFKAFSWCVGGVMLALTIAFVAYDIAAFQSRVGRIDSLIARAAPAERHPSDALRRLLIADFRYPSQAAARELLIDLEVPYNGALGWHGTCALWSLLARIHLTGDERIAILASRTIVTRGSHGFAEGAARVFGRPLERLNEEELATLVVMARRPIFFSRPEYRDRIPEFRAELLERARALH